ncbi:MAG: protein TolR [Deltaproteobacteria bacterium]|nr:MAG: protein TolR [Deltaproteobacteria bacterium]
MGIEMGSGSAMSDINVTPLVDVMMVLLIIFMVATPMIVEEAMLREIAMDLPVTRENPTVVDITDTSQLILRIDANLRVYVGEELITDCSTALDRPGAERFEPCFDEIQEKLGQNPRLQDEGALYLLADTGIPYGFVVGSMNRIRLAGVHSVGMVTNPEYLTGDQRPGP